MERLSNPFIPLIRCTYLINPDYYSFPTGCWECLPRRGASYQWIGAWQSTYKNGFPARSLPTAPGCNALAALRPLSLSLRDKAQLHQWLYAVWHFSKKVPWLPETTRHRLSALPGSQRRRNYKPNNPTRKKSNR
jgi:hypothetical protein